VRAGIVWVGNNTSAGVAATMVVAIINWEMRRRVDATTSHDVIDEEEGGDRYRRSLAVVAAAVGWPEECMICRC